MNEPLPPHAQLIQMGTDQLAAGPRRAAESAGPMRLHAPSLHRLGIVESVPA